MIRNLTLTAAVVFGLVAPATSAFAEGDTHVEDFAFPFEGPFGSYDQMQLQRGLRIFTEVCSSCHGLKYVRIGTLSDEGGPMMPEDQVLAYAEAIEVFDPALNDGEGDYRPATPADKFPANTGADAPDLSLMAKARAGFHGPYGTGISQLINGMGGPEYIASILSGYAELPACAEGVDIAGSYNTAFAPGAYPDECLDEHGHRTVPGSWIAMPQPLMGDDVTHDDGHSTDLHHESQDVAAFLMWTAEPKLDARKSAGLKGVIFLTLLSVLLYLTNKRLWAPHKGTGRKDH